MRKTLALSLGLVALVSSSAQANPGIQVHALVPGVSVSLVGAGTTCGLASVGEPNVNVPQVGVLFGGPLVVAVPPLATVSMKCTVQVGAANSAHNGADEPLATATSITTVGVTAALNVPIQYPGATGQPVYVCTQTTINGVDHYWDGSTWWLSSAAQCVEAFVQEV